MFTYSCFYFTILIIFVSNIHLSSTHALATKESHLTPRNWTYNLYVKGHHVWLPVENKYPKDFVKILTTKFWYIHNGTSPICNNTKRQAIIIPWNAWSCDRNGNIFHSFECRLNHFSIALDYEIAYSLQNALGGDIDKYIMHKLTVKDILRIGHPIKSLEGCFDVIIDKDEYFLHRNFSNAFQRLLLNEIFVPKSGLKVLAVNRKRNRRVMNLNEITSFLEQNVTYVNDTMDLGSPINIFKTFRQFNVFIAAHGQQLINMFFLPKCSIVIELQQRGFFTDWFAKMALKYGMIYGFIYSQDQNSVYRQVEKTLRLRCHHAPDADAQKILIRYVDHLADFSNIGSILEELTIQRKKCLREGQTDAFIKKRMQKLNEINRYYYSEGINRRVKSYISLYSNRSF